jgi:DNA modification methylase
MDFNDIVDSISIKPYYLDRDAGQVIYCSDCRLVLPLIPDKSIDLVLTDPPYNVSTNDIDKGNGILKQNFGEWDKDFHPEDFVSILPLSENGQIYAFSGDGLIGDYHHLFNEKYGFYKLLVMWRSNPCPQFRKRTFVSNCQYINWSRRGKYVFNFTYQNEMHTCFKYSFNEEKWGHPNQKDKNVLQKLIILSSNEGQLVLDPYMGSGSTLVASKKLGRKCIGIEIEEKYCKIAVDRLRQSVMKLDL